MPQYRCTARSEARRIGSAADGGLRQHLASPHDVSGTIYGYLILFVRLGILAIQRIVKDLSRVLRTIVSWCRDGYRLGRCPLEAQQRLPVDEQPFQSGKLAVGGSVDIRNVCKLEERY